jgi:hypothetical protein
MSAGNLTGGTLSLDTLYVDGVSITGPAGAGVNSLEALIGELVIADDGAGSMAVGTSGNNITIDTTLASGVASMVAGSNGIDIVVPGASISSIILVSIHKLDQTTSTHILSAAPSLNKIEVVLSASASVATTGSVQWTVLQF